MIELPPKPRAKYNETRDITHPIRAALNAIPGVRFARNNNLGPVVPLNRRFDVNTIAIVAGLGEGSADLVGIVRMPGGLGRAAALECKTATGRIATRQKAWLRVFRALGGFACVVRSIDDAKAAIVRCREGLSE